MHRHHLLSPNFPPSSRFVTTVAGFTTVAALVGGCMDEPVEREAPDLLERDGIEYERLGPIVEDDAERPTGSKHAAKIDALAVPLESTPLTEYSREALADKLRPVIATGEGQGEVYIASEPAWAAADVVLAGDELPFSVEPVEREGRPTTEPAVDDGFRAIFGSDNRHYVPNTGYSPFNAIARLHMFHNGVDEGTCTGVYIGPWTLITAAHCLVYTDTQRANRIIFEPARAGGTLPYGSFDCRLDDASTSNDYLWSVPSGFYTGQDANFDYAVIDTFPCHSAPANMPGYQANEPSGNFYLYGYSGDTCPGAPNGQPYNCGMSGSAYPNGVWMESQSIDATDGQSGGPWFRYFSGTGYKPVGTHTGYIEYFDLFRCGFENCKRNAARRIDNAYSQFIVDVAWDF